MRAPRPFVLIAALWGIACFPGLAAAESGYDDAEETDSLPSYAEEEWDQAQGAVSGDDYGDAARQLPAPPNDISQPRNNVAGPQMQAQMQAVPAADAERPGVNFDDFYAGLSSEGNWVETPEYGYVFIPYRQAQVSDWRPYTYGRWVWTSYGWTWASDEPFGWATYHYGRWAFMAGYGWAWVPGYTWGPAWVAWRYGDAAVGWAPLYPGYVVYSASYPVYYDHWVFIGPRYFYGYPVHHHHYGWNESRHYYGGTTWAHNWRDPRSTGTVYSGPPRGYVERRGGVAVRNTRLQSVSRPGDVRGVSGNRAPDRLSFYRPDARGARRPSAGSHVKVPQNNRTPSHVGSGLVSSQRPGSYQLAPTARGGGNRSQDGRFGGRGNVGPGSNAGGNRSPGAGNASQSGALRGGRDNGPRVQQPSGGPGRSVPPAVRQPGSRGVPQVQQPASSPAPARKSNKRNQDGDRSTAPRSLGGPRAPSQMQPSPAPAPRNGGRGSSGSVRGGSQGGGSRGSGQFQGFRSSSNSTFSGGGLRSAAPRFSGAPSFGSRSFGAAPGAAKRSSAGSIRRGH